MHARIFSYGLARDAMGPLFVLGDTLARQPGYRGRIVVAAGDRLLDWQLHDCQASALRAWALVNCALSGPHLTAAIRLVGEGAVTAYDCCGLHAAGRPGS